MALGTGFSGHLSIVPLREVLKKLHVAGETGRLCLFTPMARATVWLNSGDVVDAEIGVRKGEAALDVLSILCDGTFTFFAEASEREGSVTAAELIEHNWRAKSQRVEALLAELPSLIDALTWDPAALALVDAESADNRLLLSALRSGGTLLEALIDVDVELTVALELFLKALSVQKKTGQAMREAHVSPSRTLEQVASSLPFHPPVSGGAIVGVRPPRTVLNIEKRSTAPVPPTAPSLGETSPLLVAQGRDASVGTLLGLPTSEIVGLSGPNVIKEAAPQPSKARRFAQVSQADVAMAPPDALHVGDVLELVPETVRPRAPRLASQPAAAGESGQSDIPPPSSLEAGSMLIAGRRLARVSLLADGARFSVQLVVEAAGSSGSEIALKLPRCNDDTIHSALEMESRVLSAVSHPNLVQLLQTGVDGGSPFLMTRYVPGVSLANLIRPDRPLPVGLVVCLVRQALDAMMALHDAANPRGGFVHCNLCPENLIVGVDGVVRVCGLSNARRNRSKVNDEDLHVHAQYAAPELLRGERVDERSDVFAAGVLLGLALRTNGAEDVASLSQVRAVCARAADLVPAQRYQSASDFGMALERLPNIWGPSQVADWLAKDLAQLKLEAARSMSPAPELSQTWRRYLAIGLGTLVVVVVAVVLAWILKK